MEKQMNNNEENDGINDFIGSKKNNSNMNHTKKVNNNNINTPNSNKNKKKKKKKKKSKIRVVIRIILLLLLLALIIYGINFAIRYSKHTAALEDQKVEYDPLSATALGIDPDKLKEVGRINVLVLGESGIPGDESGWKLTDSIMVASYNPQTQQASILSIPRDTYVGKRDKNSATQNYLASYKINTVYRSGSNIDETIECVSNVTGLDLEHYILIDTDAIIDIVDAIGGVTFDVPIDMDYDDDTQGLHIFLEAGEQLIDGPKAEQLLRFRHNNDGSSYPSEYGDNDIGRMRTQRDFIQATAKQLFRLENVTKVLDLLDIVFNKVQTNIDFETMLYYIPYIFKFNTENIITDTLPGTPELCNGIWIYTVDKEATEQVVEDLFTDRVVTEEELQQEALEINQQEDSENEEQTTVELLNGTDNKNLLVKAKEALKEKGFTVTKTGTTSTTSKTSIINRTKQSTSKITNIEKALGVGSSTSGSNNSNVDITVIIGEDYE